MKVPQDRNCPIDLKRYKRWLHDFSGYRHNVSEDRIRDWLNQFDQKDVDMAARLLDCVDFISHEQISAAYRQLLASLDGWNRNAKKRAGRWRFVPYSSSAGESGDSMLQKFRLANNLASKSFNDLFIYRSDILRARLGHDDTVVLVDDFVGTGEQVCKSWDDTFGELLAEVGRVYLVVVVARRAAVTRIAQETDLALVSHVELSESDEFFSGHNAFFTEEEKQIVLDYCKYVDERRPKGFGDCGLVVVFSHTCPNNTIPLLHKATDKWEPLFRRYD